MSAVPIAKLVGAWLPVTWFPVAVVSVVPVAGVAVVWQRMTEVPVAGVSALAGFPGTSAVTPRVGDAGATAWLDRDGAAIVLSETTSFPFFPEDGRWGRRLIYFKTRFLLLWGFVLAPGDASEPDPTTATFPVSF